MRSLGIVLLFAAAAVVSAQQAPAYRLTHTYVLGGEESWDYIIPDAAQHRLFIGRHDRVMVVDERSGKVVGEIGGIHGAHGIALVEGAGRGFATSGDDASVVMFDLKTLNALQRIPAGEDADAIIYDDASGRVFSFNGDAHSATLIEGKTGKVAANVALGGKPEYGASAGDGKVFVNITDTSEVVEIDAKQAKVLRRWSTAPCKQPVSMAIDTAHRRLFSGCRSGVLAVSDYATGKVVATAAIGGGVDGAGYDASLGMVLTSNADGTLTVIHQESADRYRVVENLKTPPYSRNLGIDPVTHHVFVAAAKFGPAPSGGKGRGPMVAGSFSLMEFEPTSR